MASETDSTTPINRPVTPAPEILAGEYPAFARLANLAAGERRHAEHQEEQQENEKIEAGRNNAGSQQFEQSDHFQEQDNRGRVRAVRIFTTATKNTRWIAAGIKACEIKK